MANATTPVIQINEGKVGIGTTSPATELQIGDYTDSAETITIAASNNGTGRINFYDQNDTEGGSIRVVGQNLGSKMYFSNRWNTDNDRVVFDLTTGNVGIGATDPSATLHLSAASPYIYVDDTSTTGTLTRFQIINGDVGTTQSALFGFNNTSGTSTLNVLTMNEAGNVGIGATDPDEKLVLYRPINYAADSALYSAYAVNSTAVDNNKVFKWKTGITGNQGGHNLTFSTLARTESSYTERMRISVEGNVGINATAYLGFNGAGDASHSIAYNAGIDGVQLRGQNGVIFGTGGGTTAVERIRITSAGTLLLRSGAFPTNQDAPFLYRIGGGSLAIGSATETGSGAHVALYTNSLERMRIDSSGLVGINVTSPQTRLQTNLGITGSYLGYLNGTASTFDMSANVAVVHNSPAIGNGTGAGLVLANNDKSNGAPSPIIAFSAKSASNSYNHTYAAIYGVRTATGADTNWTKGDIVLATGAGTGPNEIMRVTSAGNVGIGEVGPSSKLVVRKDNAGGRGGEISIVNYATNTVGNEAALNFGLESSTYDADLGNAQIKARVMAANAASDMIFSTWNGTSFGERMRIEAGGNVGIGVTVPLGKLHVALPSYTNEDTNSQQAIFGASNGYGVRIGYNETDNKGYINVLKPGVAWGSLILQEDVGNVGIGTTSPGATLDVDDGNSGKIRLLRDGSVRAEFTNAANEGEMGLYRSNNVKTIYISSYYDSYFNGGNVGIGVTGPTKKIDVYQSTVGTGVADFRHVNGNRILVNPSYNYYDAYNHIFRGLSGTNTHMTIDNVGNVGIGDNTPDYRLAVKKVNAATPAIMVSGAHYGGPRIQTYGLDADANAWMGLGTDMSGAAYEHSIYFSDYNGNGRLTMGTYNGTTYSTKMTILRDGNVGIGTTIPDEDLTIQGITRSVGSLYFGAIGTDNGTYGPAISTPDRKGLNFDYKGNTGGEFQVWNHDQNGGGAHEAFTINQDSDIIMAGTSSPGHVGIGLDNPSSILHVKETLGNAGIMCKFEAGVPGTTYGAVNMDIDCIPYGYAQIFHRDGNSGGNASSFRNGSSTVGSIIINTSSTSYNTTSDYRLKENLTPITDGIERVKLLKPKRFNFIGDPEVVDGFIAHEAKEVVKEAVTGEKDGVLPNGELEYQGIDQSKLVPLLTAALQEAIKRIEILEEKINK